MLLAIAAVLQKRKTADSDSDDDAAAASDEDEEAPAPKRGRGRPPGKPAAAAAGSKYGPKVEKLKRMCRSAGIGVAPSLYRKVTGCYVQGMGHGRYM